LFSGVPLPFLVIFVFPLATRVLVVFFPQLFLNMDKCSLHCLALAPSWTPLFALHEIVAVNKGTFMTYKLDNRPWVGKVLKVLGEKLYEVRDQHSDRGRGKQVEKKRMRKSVSFETTPINEGSRLECTRVERQGR
jgi:hypothetical protein